MLVKATAGTIEPRSPTQTNELVLNQSCSKYLYLSTLHLYSLHIMPEQDVWSAYWTYRILLSTIKDSTDGITLTLAFKDLFVYLFISRYSIPAQAHQVISPPTEATLQKMKGLKKEFKPWMCLLGTLKYTRSLSMCLCSA